METGKMKENTKRTTLLGIIKDYQKKQVNEPKLVFSDETLTEIIKTKITENTIILGDEYNEPTIRNLGKRFEKVENSIKQKIEDIKNNNTYLDVIAVGGCTALDVGRACARIDGKLVLIPSILSTSCISVNQSVIYSNGNHESIVTPIPTEVIISFPLLLKSKHKDIYKWSHSGFGDLFANISATIGYLYKRKENVLFNKRENINVFTFIQKYVPESIDALKLVIDSFEKFDKKTVKKLACYLHNSSLDVIRRGNYELSANWEHDLYYSMMKQQNYDHRNPTHGELVSIGTFLSAKIISSKLRQDTLFQMLKKAFKKLGIPTNYKELVKIGVEKEHITKGLDVLKNKDTFISYNFKEKLLDECYDNKY